MQKQFLTERNYLTNDLCKLKGHENNTIKFICCCLECPYKYQKACAHCVIKLHSNHVEQMKELNEFNQLIKENYQKAKILIKESEQLFQTLKNPFETFFNELKLQLIELINNIQQQFLEKNQELAQQIIKNELSLIEQFNLSIDQKKCQFINQISLDQYKNNIVIAYEKIKNHYSINEIKQIVESNLLIMLEDSQRNTNNNNNNNTSRNTSRILTQRNNSCHSFITPRSALNIKKKFNEQNFMSILQSRQIFSISAPHIDSSQISSSPKKEYFQASKQLEATKRRIQLLRLENELKEKKLLIQQQKQDYLNRIKEDREQFKEQKNVHKQQMNVQLQTLVSRTRNMKLQQYQEKQLIQYNFRQFKQQEVKNIKLQSQRNENIIHQNNESLKQQKLEQKVHIQNQILEAQQTIQNFRRQKYLKFQYEHNHSNSQHSMEAEIKLQQIEELKKQEAYLLIKLDETSQQVNKLNQSAITKLQQTTPKTTSQ